MRGGEGVGGGRSCPGVGRAALLLSSCAKDIAGVWDRVPLVPHVLHVSTWLTPQTGPELAPRHYHNGGQNHRIAQVGRDLSGH